MVQRQQSRQNFVVRKIRRPAIGVAARNHRRSCSQTAPFPARISCQWGEWRAHIICHCACHHRAVLANGGTCSQSVPTGFDRASDGWLFSITNVSDDLRPAEGKPDLEESSAFSKLFWIAAFRNTSPSATFKKAGGGNGATRSAAPSGSDLISH